MLTSYHSTFEKPTDYTDPIREKIDVLKPNNRLYMQNQTSLTVASNQSSCIIPSYLRLELSAAQVKGSLISCKTPMTQPHRAAYKQSASPFASDGPFPGPDSEKKKGGSKESPSFTSVSKLFLESRINSPTVGTYFGRHTAQFKADQLAAQKSPKKSFNIESKPRLLGRFSPVYQFSPDLEMRIFSFFQEKNVELQEAGAQPVLRKAKSDPLKIQNAKPSLLARRVKGLPPADLADVKSQWKFVFIYLPRLELAEPS